ncbi:MAG: carbohydrate-binding module family 20 domain-containing protein [Verrucomicrobiota bacterium]
MRKKPLLRCFHPAVAEMPPRLYLGRMSRIRFRIVPPVDRPSGAVYISGNHPALGSWNPAGALPLVFDGVFHTASIEADTGYHIEYKIHRGSWEMEEVEAFGNVAQNHSHEVWLDATLHHTVADWKDRYAGRLTRERLHSRVLAGERELAIWLPPAMPASRRFDFPLFICTTARMSSIPAPAWSPAWIGPPMSGRTFWRGRE